MAEQLWKGRFSKAVDSRVNDFNSSIRFDQRMIAQDMRGSGVHAAMLARQGIISEQDCADILSGLASIADDLSSGALTIDPAAEDVHTFVEQTLTARIGDAGKRLHTGRSRNDQVALDIRLTLRDYSKTLQAYIVELVRVLCKKAAENTAAVMPGYTHLQRAQPITFGHALMAYASMLLRDLDRFADATARMDSQCPLGSGALAGTTYPLDRDFTAEKLGFAAPCANSLDGVSDRDFCIELASAISICMMHLSRLSEEIILWCSWEFKFIELDDAFTTGSSIMPQKKNPDVTELIRGKTGRVYGDLNTLLVMMKGIPLAYDKDMQQGTGHGKALALPAGQVGAALVERRCKAALAAAEVCKVHLLQRRPELGFGCIGPGHPEVGFHRALEDGRIVGHQCQQAQTVGLLPIADRDAAQRDLSLRRGAGTGQDGRYGALAAAAFAHQRDKTALRDGQGHIVQDGALLLVTKSDMLQRKGAVGRVGGLFAIFRLLGREQPEDLLSRSRAIHGNVEVAAQQAQGQEEIRRQQEDGQGAGQTELAFGKGRCRADDAAGRRGRICRLGHL